MAEHTTEAQLRLAEGDEFPHDAPNSFWFSSSGSITAPAAEDWAHRAARAIMADTRHRAARFGITKSGEDERREQVSLIAAIIRLAQDSARTAAEEIESPNGTGMEG